MSDRNQANLVAAAQAQAEKEVARLQALQCSEAFAQLELQPRC